MTQAAIMGAGTKPCVNGNPFDIQPSSEENINAGSPGVTQAAREGDEIDAGYLPEDADVGGHAVKAQVPRVYYATRTHSQIAQVSDLKQLTRQYCTPACPLSFFML